MIPTKLVEAIRMLEENGFTLIRSNGHRVCANGVVRVALAHDKMVSPGVMRSVVKAIKRSKSEIGTNYA